MQVKEVENKGLKRSYIVTIPVADVETHFTNRLNEIGKTANIHGFRPGKVPFAILKQNYGASVRGDVIEQTVSESTSSLFAEKKVKPALQPKIEMVEYGEGKDLEFKVEVEVLPEVKVGDLTKVSVEKPVVDVEEAKVTEAIEKIAKRVRKPEAVKENRAAKLGDVAVIDFDGTVDGERQPGMKSDNHELELGSKSFIDTFEDQIVGMKVGDKKDIKVHFPKEYHAPNLADKDAVFAVTLKELRAHKEVTLDDALAAELGMESFEDLKKRVVKEMSDDYEKGARAVMKRSLLDQLFDMHKFDVPEGLLDLEFNGIWQQFQQAKKMGDISEADKKKSDDVLRTEYRAIAERRIRLGLVLAQISEEQKIEVSSDEVRNAMIEEARRFPGQEMQVINYYTKTEGAIERLRAPILEEKTVDYILTKAKVADKKMSLDALIKLQEEDED